MSKELTLIKQAAFGNVECNFYKQGKEVFMTRQQIGEALEYKDPKRALSDIHRNNKERLDKFSVVRKIRTTDGKEYETYLYSAKGVYEICRWSNQKKANDFYDFVYEILEALRTGKQTMVDTDELKKLRVDAMLKNANARLEKINTERARMLMEAAEKFKGEVAPESIQVMINKATELMTGRPIISLPKLDGKFYTAKEIADELKISGHKVGCISEANNLKTEVNGKWILDKSPWSNKNVRSFLYNETGRAKIISLYRAVQPIYPQETVLFKAS